MKISDLSPRQEIIFSFIRQLIETNPEKKLRTNCRKLSQELFSMRNIGGYTGRALPSSSIFNYLKILTANQFLKVESKQGKREMVITLIRENLV